LGFFSAPTLKKKKNKRTRRRRRRAEIGGGRRESYFAELCSGSEEGSYLRLIDFCITQL